MSKVSIGTIVRVNEKGWRAWKNPPIGLVGTVAYENGEIYSVDFRQSGWNNGHGSVHNQYSKSCWNLSYNEFDIVKAGIVVSNISELFEEEL